MPPIQNPDARALAAARTAGRRRLLCRIYELAGGQLLSPVERAVLGFGNDSDDAGAAVRTLEQLNQILVTAAGQVELTADGLLAAERALRTE
jgi:hypothetical protein